MKWPRWPEAAGLALVLLVTFRLYKGALEGFFVQDDYGWLLNSRFEDLSEYWRCFYRFNAWGSYRPLSQETFFWPGQMLFGLSPHGFHVVSIAVHLVDTVLVWALLRRFASPLPSLTGTAFFSMHGAHFTSVYWISALPEPLALVFLLASLLLFIESDRRDSGWLYALSLCAMVLGILCKESVLPLPLILAAYCVFLSPKRILRTIPFLLISGFYLLARATSDSVRAAPYALTFGKEAIENLLSYLTWAFGLTEAFFKHWAGRDGGSMYPVLGGALAGLILLLMLLSRNKSLGLFSVAWFFASLQPVLYFSGHIYPYYLSPSLAALSLLIASVLPPLGGAPDWRRLSTAAAAVVISVSAALATIGPEDRWWTGRSLERRSFLRSMQEVDARVPAGRTAFIVGLDQSRFDVFENGIAFRAFRISPDKFYFVLPGLDPNLDLLSKGRAPYGRLEDSYCFVYDSGAISDRTRDFRRDPASFLGLPAAGLEAREGIRLETGASRVRRGVDTLELRAVNFRVSAIDLLYSVNGRMMPPVTRWLLDENQRATVFVDNSTQKGLYRFLAIRDTGDRSPGRWIRVDATVLVE